MQLRVTEPEVAVLVRVTLGAPRLQAVPPFCVRATVPVNPLAPVTVIVELAGEPTLTTIPVGLAVTVKSTIWNVMGGVV